MFVSQIESVSAHYNHYKKISGLSPSTIIVLT